MAQSYTTPSGSVIKVYREPSPDGEGPERVSVTIPGHADTFDLSRDDAKELGSYLVGACLRQLVPDEPVPDGEGLHADQ